MNKNTIIWILSIAAAILLSALVTLVVLWPNQPFSNSTSCPPPMGKGYLYAKLNLSAAQKPIIDDLIDKHRQEVSIIHDSLNFYREKLLDELEKEHSDTQKMEGYIQRINTFESKLQHAFVKHAMNIKKILTRDQQREFFDHFREKWNRLPRKNHPGFRYHKPC
jgi:Spy/CpxP family protein refolding chaperone